MSPRKSGSIASFVERHDLWSAEQERARARGRTRDQKAQTRSGALFLRRSARRAARQDLAGVGSGKRHAQRRVHDHDAVGKRHLAQKRVSGVHRWRRLRHGGNGRRRRLRHDRRSGDVPRAALGGKNRLALMRHRFSQTAEPVPFSTRARCRDALATLAKAGFDMLAGLEVEFHLFKLENARLNPADATWPPQAPEVSLLTQGYQYLTETRYDLLDPAVTILRRGIERSACRCARWKSSSGRARSNSPSARRPAWRAPTPWCCSAPRVKQIARRQRLSGELHVPSRTAQRDVERLASAPVADR